MSLNPRGRLHWWLGAFASVSLLGACGAPEERGGDSLEQAEPAVRDAVAGDVEVRLSLSKSALAAREAVMVDVTLTNVSSRTVRLLKWHTPVDGVKEDLFVVTVDGAAAEYNGRHYKWATPEAHDYLTLAPGERVTHTVDLASIYDLSRTGNYSIRYDSEAHHDASHEGISQLRSDSVSVYVEGRTFVLPHAADEGTVTAQALSTANCSSTRASTVSSAFSAAKTMANNSVSYLTNTTPGNTSRYKTWFGNYTSTGWSTAKSHFNAIKSAFDTRSVIVDCGCSDSAYAYVYKNSPYRIYVCNAFWNAPMTGTDSKGGTLVHEMSHFTVVADTDDHAYGQSACKNLAISSPTRALDNADSHEYFAENTPAQN